MPTRNVNMTDHFDRFIEAVDTGREGWCARVRVRGRHGTTPLGIQPEMPHHI